jgi:hypothetical protein
LACDFQYLQRKAHMGKPTTGITRGDLIQPLSHCPDEGWNRSATTAAQKCLELGESFFNRVGYPAGRRLWVPRGGHYHLVIGQLVPQKAA